LRKTAKNQTFRADGKCRRARAFFDGL